MNTYKIIRGLLGSWVACKEQLVVAVLMLIATGAYEALSAYFVPGFTFNIYEFIGTWSGLVCVWLSRTRNILSWPWGIVSAAALGMFFYQIELPGQQWLNWGYFLIISLWAWPHWAFGGKDRSELPVTTLTWSGRGLTLLAVLVGTVIAYLAIDLLSPGSFHPILDATVVASSIVAQFLLGRKKIESWILWLGPVNLLSIGLFFMAGAYTVCALYIAFFIHAAFAIHTWHKARTVSTLTA